MVKVQFLRTGDKLLRTIGPFPWVRLDGKSLQAGPNGEEIAHYHGGVWYAAELSAPKYVVHGSACTVRFQSEGTEEFTIPGPLDKVEVVDGAVYTQPGQRLIARLDEERKAWYTYEDKRFWPSLVMERYAGPEGS